MALQLGPPCAVNFGDVLQHAVGTDKPFRKGSSPGLIQPTCRTLDQRGLATTRRHFKFEIAGFAFALATFVEVVFQALSKRRISKQGLPGLAGELVAINLKNMLQTIVDKGKLAFLVECVQQVGKGIEQKPVELAGALFAGLDGQVFLLQVPRAVSVADTAEQLLRRKRFTEEIVGTQFDQGRHR